LRITIAGNFKIVAGPAPSLTASLQQEAEHAARKVLESLGYVGVLCIEFFEMDGRLLAKRDGSAGSQFRSWTIEGP